MAGNPNPNSCRTWHHILNKREPQILANLCFELSNGQCVDSKPKQNVEVPKISVAKNSLGPKTSVRNSLEPQTPVVKFLDAQTSITNVLEPQVPVRRLIDIEAECSKCPRIEKDCKFSELDGKNQSQNLCSTKCRPLITTNLHTKEYVQRSRPKPDYKHSCILDHKTAVGRVFPMKFRIRRQFSQCSDCDRDLKLRETVTDAKNMVLLSNCCNVEICPEEKIENWHIVPVGMISGAERFSKKLISEECHPPMVIEVKRITIPDPVKNKKRKKKSKSKKGAKGKKGKKKR